MRFLLRLLILSLLVGCGSTRKISNVGLREPSSVVSLAAIPAEDIARQEVMDSAKVGCFPTLRENLRKISSKKLDIQLCDGGLSSSFQLASGFLTLGERELVESYLRIRCLSLDDTLNQRLRNFLFEYDSKGPLSRYSLARVNDTQLLGAIVSLRDELRRTLEVGEPIRFWQKKNGDYLVPDSVLSTLWRINQKAHCAMSDAEVFKALSEVKILEDLDRYLPDSEQKKILQETLRQADEVLGVARIFGSAK